jgi:hypothetical protein
MDSFLGNTHMLQESMQLVSAYAVEQELQESRRKEQLEKSSDNDPENSRVRPAPYRGLR